MHVGLFTEDVMGRFMACVLFSATRKGLVGPLGACCVVCPPVAFAMLARLFVPGKEIQCINM